MIRDLIVRYVKQFRDEKKWNTAQAKEELGWEKIAKAEEYINTL